MRSARRRTMGRDKARLSFFVSTARDERENVSRYYRNIDPLLTTHHALDVARRVEKCKLHLKFPHLGQ